MRKAYYVTVGNNGGIITNDYHHALLCKKYLWGHVYVRKFFDFEEAEDYLLDHVMEMAPLGCHLPDHCRLNQIITIRKLLAES